MSSTYLNLDALSLSSEEESQELAKRSDLSVTLFCSSEEAGTCVNSDEVFSDEDFPAVFGARDIRQVVRRYASPPGSQTIGEARDDRQHEPPASVVDLVTGKCKPGKVSTSPLTLDLTVVCTSGVKVLPPGASTQVVLPPATVASTVTAIGTNTPFVAAPAPVVEQPGLHAREFPTLRLSESPELLPLFGLSSLSPSPTLPWGAAEDSSPPFSPNRVQAGHSQDVPDEGSLFNVSPLSPGLFLLLPRGSKLSLAGGVLLPTTLEDFDDSVLGDPITYARCEQLPGSESPLSLPVYAWPSGSAFLLDPTITILQTVLASGTSTLPAEETSTAAPPRDSGEGKLLETGLPGCPYRFSESGGLPFTDGNPAYGLQLHHPRFLELVGAPESARLLDCSPTFWVDQLGKEQAMAAAIHLQRDAGVMLSNLQILSQFAMAMNRMSFSMMASWYCRGFVI